MWIGVLIFAIIALVIGLYGSIVDYMMNPIFTSYDIISGQPIDFPDVYVCPSNYVNFTFVQEHEVNLSWAMYFRGENQAKGNGTKSESLLNMKQNLWDKILPPLPPPPKRSSYLAGPPPLLPRLRIINGTLITILEPETTTQVPEETTTKEPEFRVNLTDFQEYFMQIGKQ